jgi:hypothetical protein
MIENKAVTYSLLAHIRNTGTLLKGPVDAFVPLIKRVLYKINSEGILKGDSILEIQNEAFKMYSIDFPIPVLRTILIQVANEVNIEDEINFQLHKDNSFILKDFYFEDFEEKIQESKRDVETLEKLFVDFVKINNLEVVEKSSIIKFIDKNKISISKYLCYSHVPNGHDYTIEAKFVDFFKKIPDVYEIIRRIYLGSIISSYLEFRTENIKQDVELLFDTNFIISLLDLNTRESTHTCNKLIEIGDNLGYKFSILKDTIEEIKALLNKKAEYFSDSFLSKRINSEDIYNACERRNLGKNDLERIADNIEELLKKYNISIITYTENLKNQAKLTKEYKNLKKVRFSDFSALHDATAIYYVSEKRKIRIKEFEKVNCWFVNNSINHDNEEFRENIPEKNNFQNEIIRADELLNILWLTNPSINKSINNDDLIDIGLTSIVAFTLNDSLPKASIIKELDSNIQKYRGTVISDKDILLISSRISNRQLKNISELNNIANKNQDLFVSKLKEEAKNQEEEDNIRISKFEVLFQKFEKQISGLDKERIKLKNKETNIDKEKENDKIEIQKLILKLEEEKKERIKIENEAIEGKRKIHIDLKVKEWRNESWIKFVISIIAMLIGLIYIMNLSNWKSDNFTKMLEEYKNNFYISTFISVVGLIFSLFVLKELRERYYNHSNIKAFRDLVEIPKELKNK